MASAGGAWKRLGGWLGGRRNRSQRPDRQIGRGLTVVFQGGIPVVAVDGDVFLQRVQRQSDDLVPERAVRNGVRREARCRGLGRAQKTTDNFSSCLGLFTSFFLFSFSRFLRSTGPQALLSLSHCLFTAPRRPYTTGQQDLFAAFCRRSPLSPFNERLPPLWMPIPLQQYSTREIGRERERARAGERGRVEGHCADLAHVRLKGLLCLALPPLVRARVVRRSLLDALSELLDAPLAAHGHLHRGGQRGKEEEAN